MGTIRINGLNVNKRAIIIHSFSVIEHLLLYVPHIFHHSIIHSLDVHLLMYRRYLMGFRTYYKMFRPYNRLDKSSK